MLTEGYLQMIYAGEAGANGAARPLRLGSVTVTGISFLFRTTVRVKLSLPRLDRRMLVISRVVVTFESSTFRITSPAFNPAFSAGEFLITDFTSTPSLTPKKSASCPCGASDSPSMPISGLCQDISNRGISMGGTGGIAGTVTGPLGVSITMFLRAPTVTGTFSAAPLRHTASVTWRPGG